MFLFHYLGVYFFATSLLMLLVESSHDDNWPSRPNILLLLTDDQDVMLGSFDHMPHVKALLQELGMTFTNAFVHTPICCPSRSSILTGRYLHNGGARNNSLSGNCYGQHWKEQIESQHTYAVHAKQLGYTTAFAGKYLNQYGLFGKNQPLKVPPGWDHWFGLVGNSKYYNYNLIEGGAGKEPNLLNYGNRYPEDYLPNVLKEYTSGLLPVLQEPWLLVVSWPTPHAPFTPAPWAIDTMKDHHPPITKNYNASDLYMHQKHWVVRRLLPMTEEVSQTTDQHFRRRLEALKTVDNHVGELVNRLEHLGQLDRTVILYTSDNGFQFGQHRLPGDKRHLYENDIRVPLCIRGPNIPPNTTSTNLVANIDIAPSILDMVGQDESAWKTLMDGTSFWNHVRGMDDQLFTHRRDILITYHGEGMEPCGMINCPPSFTTIDSFNNTYNCVRTLHDSVEDSIYCRFDDDENFVEFYDLTTNRYQLDNNYAELEIWQRQRYEHILQELIKCQGSTCRSNEMQ